MTEYQKEKLFVKLDYYFNLSGIYLYILAGFFGFVTFVAAIVHLIF